MENLICKTDLCKLNVHNQPHLSSPIPRESKGDIRVSLITGQAAAQMTRTHFFHLINYIFIFIFLLISPCQSGPLHNKTSPCSTVSCCNAAFARSHSLQRMFCSNRVNISKGETVLPAGFIFF